MVQTAISFDVIIIGGGLAGLMAAVAAADAGAVRVLVFDKCEIGKSGATVQAKRLAAVGSWSFPEDSPDQHLQDTLASGCYINDQRLARAMVEDAEQVVLNLEAIGMHFEEKNPSLYASPGKSWAGHSHYRLLQCQDSTGKVLLDVLRREAYRKGVAMRNDCVATDLLVDVEGCYGIVDLDYRTGTVSAILAGAVIIATGRSGLPFCTHFQPTTNDRRRDGACLRSRCGADGFGNGAVLSDKLRLPPCSRG